MGVLLLNEDNDVHKGGLPVRSIPCTFKLVKDAVVFIEGTQLAPKVIMDLFCRKQLLLFMKQSKTKPPNQSLDLCFVSHVRFRNMLHRLVTLQQILCLNSKEAICVIPQPN